MIPAVAAASYAAFQEQGNRLQTKKFKAVTGPTVTKQGSTWVCNGKVYKKTGEILTCGSASWVGIKDEDVRGIILRDSIS